MSSTRKTSAAKLRAGALSNRGRASVGLVEADGHLHIVTFDRSGGMDVIGAEMLRPFPNLARPVADAVLRNAQRSTVTTAQGRRRLLHLLQAGLLAFLLETGRSSTTLQQLGTHCTTAFIRWLNEPSAKSGKLRTEYVRASYYQAFTQLVGLLHDGGSSDRIGPENLPLNPWPHAKRSITGTAEINEHDLRAVARRCATLVRETATELTRDLDLVEGDQPSDKRLAERRRVLLAVMALPPSERSKAQLLKRDPVLARAASEIGLTTMDALVLPSLIHLMPFLLLLAITFRLNEAVLLGADQSDFMKTRWMGGDRIVARPFKARAGRRQRLSASAGRDAVNPEQIIKLMERWTLNLRRHRPTDGFVVYANPRASDDGVVIAKESHNFSIVFGRQLRSFLAKEGLPSVTINQIRHFMLDLAHRASGGDILAVRAAGGQRSIDVVADHYVTAAGRRRSDERLGEAMMRRQWRTATSGRCDAQRHPGGDDDAATPGWRCDRSLPPPFPQNGPGGYCTSYGRCPVCVRGRIDLGSPRSYMLVLALLDAIERSKDVMAPEAWLGRLAPIRRRLIETILPAFGTEFKDAPGLPIINLPPLD